MKQPLKIKVKGKLNDKLFARISTEEKEFILRALDNLKDNQNVDLELSSFVRMATSSLAESILLGKFKVKIDIPDRTLTFKLKK